MTKKIINLEDADLISRLYDIVTTNDNKEKFFMFTNETDMMFNFLCHIAFNCFNIEETNNNKRKLLNMYATNEHDKFSKSLFQHFKDFKCKVTIFNTSRCNTVNLNTIYTVICGLCGSDKSNTIKCDTKEYREEISAHSDKCNVIMHNMKQFSDIFECKKVNNVIFVNTKEEMECK